MPAKYTSSAELRAAHRDAGLSVTLMGMSGVGKTTLARALSVRRWFHYSGDYRIGTHHLQEAIVDNLKIEAMKVDRLRRLLLDDLIHIGVNIDIDNIQIMSDYLGTIRDPENPDGLSIDEFRERQVAYREAEIRAMLDVGTFIRKAHQVYGYKSFVNDAGGSLCDIVDVEAERIADDPVLKHLGEHTLIVHINSDEASRDELIRRSGDAPKPIYYQPHFLNEQLAPFQRHGMLDENDLPGRFQALIFRNLIGNRQARYEAIAKAWGCAISERDAGELTDLWVKNPHKKERAVLAAEIENRFVDLLAEALDRE
ncbi:MAG: ATPase [Pseudomonadota bacterium]